MYRQPDLSLWHGRVDTDDAGDCRRIHQVVRAFDQKGPSGVVLLGFHSDEGVRRNGGRVGAKDAPHVIRTVLGNMAWHAGHKPFLDAGDIVCDGEKLEEAQSELEQKIRSLMKARHLPIILGGGHEVAYGTGAGVFSSHLPSSRIGIINIDAHFDLRVAPARNSGTSFADLLARGVAEAREVHYLCVGVAESANTIALFNRAKSYGASWIVDCEVRRSSGDVVKAITSFVDRCDAIYLSVDMDALPSHEAPGVSAPASLGIPFETVFMIAKHLGQSPKLCAVDIAEVNPRFDVDNRTARLAARLVHTLIHAR